MTHPTLIEAIETADTTKKLERAGAFTRTELLHQHKEDFRYLTYFCAVHDDDLKCCWECYKRRFREGK